MEPAAGNTTTTSNVKEREAGSTGEKLPPGFRFHPTDEELITYYLANKILDGGFTGRAVADVDLNKSEPWELPGKAKMGEKEWYFFSQRDRKYPTGVRTNRATNTGYWKTTGKDKEIFGGGGGGGGMTATAGELVGMKKTLVFYRGRAPRGEKSNWVMHEYRVHSKSSYRPSKQDEWVICRVFQKTTAAGSSSGKHSTATATSKYSSSAATNHHHQQQHQSRPIMTTTSSLNPYTTLHDMIAGAGPAATAAFLTPPMIGHQFPLPYNSELADLARAFRGSSSAATTSTPTQQQGHLMRMNSNLNCYSNYASAPAGGGCFAGLSGLQLNLGGVSGNGIQSTTSSSPAFVNQLLIMEQQEENVGASSSSMIMSPPFPGLTDEGSGGGGYGGGGGDGSNVEQSMDFDAYWPSY